MVQTRSKDKPVASVKDSSRDSDNVESRPHSLLTDGPSEPTTSHASQRAISKDATNSVTSNRRSLRARSPSMEPVYSKKMTRQSPSLPIPDQVRMSSDAKKKGMTQSESDPHSVSSENILDLAKHRRTRGQTPGHLIQPPSIPMILTPIKRNTRSSAVSTPVMSSSSFLSEGDKTIPHSSFSTVPSASSSSFTLSIPHTSSDHRIDSSLVNAPAPSVSKSATRRRAPARKLKDSHAVHDTSVSRDTNTRKSMTSSSTSTIASSIPARRGRPRRSSSHDTPMDNSNTLTPFQPRSKANVHPSSSLTAEKSISIDPQSQLKRSWTPLRSPGLLLDRLKSMVPNPIRWMRSAQRDNSTAPSIVRSRQGKRKIEQDSSDLDSSALPPKEEFTKRKASITETVDREDEEISALRFSKRPRYEAPSTEHVSHADVTAALRKLNDLANTHHSSEQKDSAALNTPRFSSLRRLFGGTPKKEEVVSGSMAATHHFLHTPVVAKQPQSSFIAPTVTPAMVTPFIARLSATQQTPVLPSTESIAERWQPRSTPVPLPWQEKETDTRTDTAKKILDTLSRLSMPMVVDARRSVPVAPPEAIIDTVRKVSLTPPEATTTVPVTGGFQWHTTVPVTQKTATATGMTDSDVAFHEKRRRMHSFSAKHLSSDDDEEEEEEEKKEKKEKESPQVIPVPQKITPTLSIPLPTVVPSSPAAVEKKPLTPPLAVPVMKETVSIKTAVPVSPISTVSAVPAVTPNPSVILLSDEEEEEKKPSAVTVSETKTLSSTAPVSFSLPTPAPVPASNPILPSSIAIPQEEEKTVPAPPAAISTLEARPWTWTLPSGGPAMTEKERSATRSPLPVFSFQLPSEERLSSSALLSSVTPRDVTRWEATSFKAASSTLPLISFPVSQEKERKEEEERKVERKVEEEKKDEKIVEKVIEKTEVVPEKKIEEIVPEKKAEVVLEKPTVGVLPTPMFSFGAPSSTLPSFQMTPSTVPVFQFSTAEKTSTSTDSLTAVKESTAVPVERATPSLFPMTLPTAASTEEKKESSSNAAASMTSPPLFQFGTTLPDKATTSTTNTSFGWPTTNTTATAPLTFSFGTTTPAPVSSGFTFGQSTSAPFTFGSTAPVAMTTSPPGMSFGSTAGGFQLAASGSHNDVFGAAAANSPAMFNMGQQSASTGGRMFATAKPRRGRR